MAKESNNNGLAIGLMLLGGAALAYGFMQTTPASNSSTQVGPGQTVTGPAGSWTNNTNAPVWITATGMAINAAGSIVANIADIIGAINQGAPEDNFGGAKLSGWYEGGLL